MAAKRISKSRLVVEPLIGGGARQNFRRPPSRLLPITAAVISAIAFSSVQAANDTWIGANGGYWDITGNWNPGYPNNNDTVSLGASDTVFRTGALSLASLSGTGNLSITGGALSIAQASSIGSLTMNGGTFGGAGTLTTGALTFTNGTLGQYGNGATTINVSGATTFDGTSTQQIFYGTALNLSGGATWTTSANSGSGINIYSGGQGTSSVNLKAGQTFADQGMQAAGQYRYLGNYTDGVFNNAGTYVRSGLGTTIVGAAFNNTGALQVNSGTFDLSYTQGTHSNSGSIAIASGATLEANGTFTSTTGSINNGGTLLVDGGTTTLLSTSSYSGAGAINVTGGTLDSQLTGTIAPGSLTLAGGTARFAGTVNTTPLSITNATLSGGGTINAGTLTFTNGTIGEYAHGGTTVNVSGLTTFDATSSQSLFYGTTLNLNGGASWATGANSGGAINIYSGGQGTTTVNLKAGQTFTDQGLQSAGQYRYLGNYTDGVFNNAGTYVRSGLGTTIVGVTFNNTGAIQVNSGTFDFSNTQGAHTNSGSIAIASGATLEANGTFTSTTGSINNGGTLLVDGGTTTLQSGSSYTGGGAINVTGGLFDSQLTGTIAPTSLTLTGGTTRFAGTANTSTLAISNATLSGPGTVNAGTLTFTNGTIGEYNHGGIVVNVSGSTTIDGTSSQQLYYGTTLNLNGGATWTASPGSGYAFGIYSGGQGTTTVNLKAGQTFADQGLQAAGQYRYLGNNSDGVFNNAGTYVRSGLGTTIVGATFNNTGALQVNSGTFDLGYTQGTHTNSGSIAIASGATLEANGTFTSTTGSINNGGTLLVDGGTTTLQSGSSYTGGGAINVTGGLLDSQLTGTIAPISLTLTGGTTRFAGTANTNTLAISNATLSGAGTVNAGTLTFTNGNIGEYNHGAIVVNVSGATTIDGTSSQQLYYGATLNLNGGATWTASPGSGYAFNISSGGQGATAVNLKAGQTFTDQGLQAAGQYRYLGNYGDGVFNNAGTYVRNGAGTTNINPAFNNSGAVQINSGEFNVTGTGGSSSGTWAVAAPGTLTFSGGRNTLTAGSISNAGTFNITGGALVVTGAVGVTGANGLNFTSGNQGGNGTFTLNALNWGGGTFGDSVVTGGTTTVNGPTTIDGTTSQQITYGHTLNLNGTTNWTASNQGYMQVYNAGVPTSTLNIGAGATFNDQGNLAAGQLRYFGANTDGAINVNGTYNRNGLGTTQVTSANFTNSGTINVNGGTLSLQSAAGSSGGTINIASGSTLDFTNGTFTLTGGTINNAGTASLSSGSLNVTAASSVTGAGGFTISGGQVYGGGQLNLSALTFTGGTIGGYQQTAPTVTVSGPATISGAQQNISYGATLALNGATTWQQSTQGLLSISGSGQGAPTLSIGSTGTFTDQGNLQSNQVRYLGYYSDGIVANAGTFLRTGDGTTQVNAQFNNAGSGVVTVDSGRLQFANGGTSTGTFNTGTNGTLEFSGGTYTLAGGTINSAGTAILTGGSVNVSQTTAVTGAGGFSIAGGQLYGAGALNASAFTFTGGTIGASSLAAPTINVSGPATIGGNGQQSIYYGATLNLNGATTWQQSTQGLLAISDSGQGAATLAIGATGTFTDQGNLLASQVRYLGYYSDGHVSNAGNYVRTGDGTTQVAANFTNASTGTVTVDGGRLQFVSGGTSSGTFTTGTNGTIEFGGGTFVLAGGTISGTGTTVLTGGNLNVTQAATVTGTGGLTVAGGFLYGPGAVNASAFTFTGGSIGASGQTAPTVNVSGSAVIAGNGQQGINYGGTLNLNGTTTWQQSTQGLLAISDGGQGTSTLAIGAGGTFNDQGNLQAGQVRYLGYYGDGHVTNAGTYTRSGDGTTQVSASFANTGTLNVASGSMQFTNALGGSGTLQTSGTGVLDIQSVSGRSVSTGSLVLGSSTANNLVLGSTNVAVAGDYSNAAFGTGNAFNKVANVSGTGLISAVNATQAITGTTVTNGTTANATLTINNVRVGATTYNYQVADTGTTTALRGAIQTAGNGAAITDTRLSGAGVTAGNYGPVAAGSNSGNLGVTFTASTAGMLAPLTGTNAVHIANNFANVAEQNLNIAIGAGAAAYNTAIGSATPSPSIALGNVRVNGSLSQALTVSNTQVAGAYSEDLNAAFGASTGAAVGSGSINQLVAGTSSNSAMVASLASGTAGAKTGTVTLNYATSGTVNGVSNGLDVLGVGSQTITLTGGVYNAAVGSTTPTPVTIANQRVGGAAAQTLTVANTAAAGSFSEALNASFGSNTGSAKNNGGSVSNIAAGSNNASALSVGVDTTSAGAKTGSVTIAYQTDGTGNNGHSGLAAASAGSQAINVSGNVYQVAQASVPTTVSLGNVHVGGTASQALTIGNTNISPTGYQEGLDVAVGTVGSGATASGSISNLAAGGTSSAVTVGLSTITAGANSRSVALNLATNGAGTSGLATQSLGTANVAINATGYNLAAGAATPTPVTIANQRVGGTNSQALTVQNTAASGSYTEGLNASFAGNGGSATNNGGSIALLTGQSSNANAMSVGVNTASSGAKTGTVTLNYVSDGSGTSGLGQTSVGSQIINVTGNVYQAAAGNIVTASPYNFGTVQVGQQNVSRNLTIQNVASGAAGYVEDLNASFGASTDTRISGSGAVSQLAAGNTSTAMTVNVNTSMAGTINGSIAVNYFTAGTVNGNSNGLGTAAVGSQNYGVQGTIGTTANVVDAANPQINNAPIALGNVRINATSPTAAVSVTNVASGNQQAALNASISGNAPITASGSFNQLLAGNSDATSLTVGMNTSTAGNKSGTATIAFVSDASNIGGCAPNCKMDLNPQNVSVTGGVFQVAQASVPTTVSLGNVHVGGTASQALTIGNTNISPTGYQEGLDVAVGTVGSGATASGSISNLAAGGTSSAVTVGLSTITAGANSRSVALNLATNGAGTSGLATQSLGTANVAINATGYNLAAGAATPTPVTIANQRVGGTNSQALTVQNTAASGSYTEGLNASFAGNGGSATNNGGSIALLTGQSSNANAMSVGVNTASSGAKTGTVTLNYVSDGSGTSGLGQTSVGSQTINVTGNVYALANGSAAAVTPVAARVGDTVASQTIAITNVSPDIYTEALKVTLGTTSTGFTASGSISALAAQGTSNAIAVKLDTTTAGTFTGTQALNYISTGVGTTGAADLAVGTASVALSGRVYTPAVSQLNTGSVAFGIVHVGDSVAAQGVSVTNAAATTALNDVLVGAAIGATGPFTASGNLGAGLAAQQTSTSGLKVGLDTATAGVYSGSAAFSAASHDSDLSDAALANLAVSLTGTVNNYAADAFSFGSGAGTLSQSGSTYILDYGTIQQNSGTLTTSLLAGNSATGPADLLDGSFQFLDAADFGETGFGAFANLVAGAYDTPLSFSFSSMTLGAFSDTIVLHGLGHNASGYSASIGDIQLIVRGVVAEAGTVAVPEPDSLALLGLGIPLFFFRRGRKRQVVAPH